MPDRNDSTRAQILETALQLFRSQGYQTTSISDIVEKVGVTKAAPYYYFRSKDDLLLTLVTPFLEAVDHVLDDAPDDCSSAPGRRRLLSVYLDVLVEFRPIMDLLAADVAVLNHPPIGTWARAHDTRLRRLLTGPDAGVEDEVQAACAIGALQAPIFHFEDIDIGVLKASIVECALACFGTGRRTPTRRR